MYVETPTSRSEDAFSEGGADGLPLGEAQVVATPTSYGDNLIGNSPAFRAVITKIPLLADCDATILVTGETGTGKELVAEAVHAASSRRGKPFVPVNCGALPEDLVENELFGHAKGAYTGAASNGRGLLAEAEGGTLFLDELNSLSLAAQSKLLRFLQNREFRMLGSTKIQHADVRIIAATNKDLRALVVAGQFREDLFHRLHVLSLELPALRDRPEDIPLLSEHFARVFGESVGRGDVRLTPAAKSKLCAYAWSGNVRELQSVLQRSILLSRGLELDAPDIDLPGAGGSTIVAERQNSYAAPNPSLALAEPSTDQTFREAKDRVIREFERSYLSRVLAEADGNVTHAAKIAGMQRRDLQRLLRKHDLRRDMIAA